MKMNKLYIGLLAAGVFSLSACNSFLDKEPLNAITPDNFLFTENDLSSYTNGLYGSFSTPGGWDFGWDGDNNTDNQVSTGYSTQWVPGEWRVGEDGGQWSFGNIRQCNYFINIVQPRWDNGELTDMTANSLHYLGEAYFFRAYNYFYKLYYVGDYPIVTETLPNDMDALVAASKRQPRHKVARFILEDLDRAISMLQSVNGGAVPGLAARNRVSQEAAYLLKSRVALFEASWLTYHKGTAFVPGGPGWPGDPADVADFDIDAEISFFLQECKAAAKEVCDRMPLAQNTAAEVDLWNNYGDATVDGVDYSQYKMSNPYYATFSADDMSSSPEMILWKDYKKEDYNIVSSSVFYVRTGGNTGLNRQFVETFLCRDGLPVYASPEYEGDNSLLNVRKHRDSRLQLFMMTPHEVLSTDSGFDDTEITINDYTVNLYPGVQVGDNMMFPGDTLSTVPNIMDGTRKVTTGYQLRKGLSSHWYREGNGGVEGWPIFRATEAYLNYIEASCIENGGTAVDGTADSYWRELRTRAGLPADYMITVNATRYAPSPAEAIRYVDGTQQFETDFAVYSHGEAVPALLYNIRRERRCELIGEGMRMMDLKRWRALDQLIDVNGEGYRVSGMNIWESEELALYNRWGGAWALNSNDGGNVSSEDASGKYLCPYRTNTTHILYNAGYKWAEAHYLNPIAIGHFRITSEDGSPENSVIYQNPGWPLDPNGGALE